MKKRVTALILSLCLALSLLPTTALAAELEFDSPLDSESFEWMEEVPVENVPERPDEDFYPYDASDTDLVTRGEWLSELVSLFQMTLAQDEYPDVLILSRSVDTNNSKKVIRYAAGTKAS